MKESERTFYNNQNTKKVVEFFCVAVKNKRRDEEIKNICKRIGNLLLLWWG